MSIKKPATGLFALSAFCLMAVPQVLFAQAWVITPLVGLQEEYNDNFRLSDDLNDSVFTTTVPVGVEVSRSTKTIELTGRAQYDFIEYSGDNDLQDRDNQFLDFFSLYRTETARWRFDGFFHRDTILRSVQIEPLSDIVTAPEDIDVNLVGFNIRRNRLVLKPAWDQNITERAGVGLRYNFIDVAQDDIRGVDLVDFRNHVLRGPIFFDLTQRDKVTVTPGVQFYRGEDDRDFESYTLTAGLDHAFSQTTRSGIELGARHTSFDTPAEDGSDSGFVGNAYVDRRTQKGLYSLVLERQLRPSSAGELLDTRQLSLRVNTAITPRLRFDMRARAFRTASFRDNDNDRSFVSLQPTLRWKLTRWWSLDTSYQYRWEDRDSLGDSVDSNAVLVSLTYEKPIPVGD